MIYGSIIDFNCHQIILKNKFDKLMLRNICFQIQAKDRFEKLQQTDMTKQKLSTNLSVK